MQELLWHCSHFNNQFLLRKWNVIHQTNTQTNKKAKNEHRNRDFQLHASKITQSLYQLQNNYNDKKIVSQFLVRLEKTVTEMMTGCLRMIKSAMFERRWLK